MTGMFLINYGTEDRTMVISSVGAVRAHMRIYNPQREAEPVWVYTNSINRVDN
jgi:phenylacetate-coenzyme A ligase PaaK-like adenylate-forming protein